MGTLHLVGGCLKKKETYFMQSLDILRKDYDALVTHFEVKFALLSASLVNVQIATIDMK